MANKSEVIAKMQGLLAEIEQVVSDLPAGSWSKGIYEEGWDARQLLSHMASTSGTAGFLLRLGAASSSSELPAGFDNEAFNRQQVAARQDKRPADLVAEIKGIFERDIPAVRAAPDELMQKHFRAPWDVEGELGDVIVMSLEGHLGMHLADLRLAAK
jgi:Mycothiol maleylpyruvate isomerase N-terminal domain